MRDTQEYDTTDLFYELSEDALNVEGFLDWAYQNFPGIGWTRVEKSAGWEGSVTKQWVEDVCEEHDYMVDDVHEYMVRNAEGALKMIIEADNYGYLDSQEETEKLVALINIWRAEELL